MAATATAPPQSIPAQRKTAAGRRRPPPPVTQPPKLIWPNGPSGDPEDVTGLDPEAFHEAITGRDRDQWDYQRLSAEAGRSVPRIRKWVMLAYAVADAEKARKAGRRPSEAVRRRLAIDDKVFVVPDGFVGSSPWWYASTARRRLIEIEVMHDDGRVRPYASTGRKAGAADRSPRNAPPAPTKEEAEEVLAAYREMTGEPRRMSDLDARAVLRDRFGLNGLQVGRRIQAALDAEAGRPGRGVRTRRIQVDNAALRARYLELYAEKKQAGYSDRGASERARAELSAETGRTRRDLAARILDAGRKAGTVTGDR